MNMAAQGQRGADLMETAGSGRTLSQTPSGEAALSSTGTGPGRAAVPLRASSPGPPRATRDVVPRAAQPGMPQPGQEGALPIAVPLTLPWPAAVLAPRPGRCRYRLGAMKARIPGAAGCSLSPTLASGRR